LHCSGAWEEVKGRVLIGAGTGTDVNGVSQTFEVGDTGGEYKHTLTIEEMPKHRHEGLCWTNGRSITLGGADTAAYNYSLPFEFNSNTANGIITQPTGNGETHNNVQPYLVVHIWRRISA
jgi:microcystin-dependent protein